MHLDLFIPFLDVISFLSDVLSSSLSLFGAILLQVEGCTTIGSDRSRLCPERGRLLNLSQGISFSGFPLGRFP